MSTAPMNPERPQNRNALPNLAYLPTSPVFLLFAIREMLSLSLRRDLHFYLSEIDFSTLSNHNLERSQ